MNDIVSAGILVIGDEILSGRTKDKNIGFIAEYLTNIGIDLKEVRVVADDEDDIIVALDALRKRYTYVFTTGGIGPTHDDITADSVAKAFGVGIDHHPEVVARFRERWSEQDLNEAGLRMLSDSVRANSREGDIGGPLREIANAHPDTIIGSYPFMDEEQRPNTNLVV